MISSLFLIVIFILVLDSIVSAAEAAIFTVPLHKVKQLAQNSRNARVLLSLKENMEGPIVTLISLSNLITIIGSVLAGAVAADAFGDRWVGVFATILTFLIMIFAEIIPKRLGERYAEKLAIILAIPIRGVSAVFYPVTFWIRKITGPLTLKNGPSVSREEIAFLTDLGREEGVLDEYEGQLINRVFRLADVTAGDMMTPRPFVFSFDANKSLGELQQEIQNARHARIPIYDGSKDKITGVVHQRDLLRALAEDKHITIVKEYARKPLVVPESLVGEDLLRDFQVTRQHLAIVVSDFGNMVGVVGLEDVLEELVGEILDEKDVAPELIKRVSRSEILAHGQTHIADINRFFNVRIKSKKTLNGFLLHKIGHLPSQGEKFELDDLLFNIEETAPSSIEKVKITKKE